MRDAPTVLYYHESTLEPLERMPEKREIEARTLEELEDMMTIEKEKMTTIRMEDESVESGG